MLQVEKLNNGITLVTYYLADRKSVNISYLVKSGSLYEKTDKIGLAHFVEHMLFKGTTKRTAKEINATLEFSGGSFNAYTDLDCTKYYVSTPDDKWEIGLDVLTDIIYDNTIPINEFNLEKQVIIEELIAISDDPNNVACDLAYANLYNDLPQISHAGGTIETINNMNRNDLIKFIDSNYVNKNMYVIVTGNCDHFKIADYLNKNVLNIFNRKSISQPVKLIWDPNKFSYRTMEKDVEQAVLTWGIPVGPINDLKLNLTLDLICCMLSGNLSSRLFKLLREQLGLCYYVNMEYFKNSNAIIGSMGLNKNNIKKTIELINEQLITFGDTVTEVELNNFKEYYAGCYKTQSDSNIFVNEMLTRIICSYGVANIMYINNYEQIVRSINLDDLQLIANQYLVNLAFSSVLPKS